MRRFVPTYSQSVYQELIPNEDLTPIFTKQALITAASKIILNSWRPSGMTVTRAASAFGALM